jgi:ankyrin repeat protein
MKEEGELRACDKELLDACEALDVARVRAALSSGADVNVHGTHVYGTPLIHAIEGRLWDEPHDEEEEKRRQVLEKLFEHGVDPNCLDGDGFAPMWCAAFNEPWVIEFLLKHGCDPNRVSIEELDGKMLYYTPLDDMWGEEAYCALDCKFDEVKKYEQKERLLLAYGARPYADEELTETHIDVKEVRTFENVPPIVFPEALGEVAALSEDEKALFEACKKLDVEAVRDLIQKGCNVNARDAADGGATPLCVVTELQGDAEKSLSIAKELLEHGADPNIPKVWKELDFDEVTEWVYGQSPLGYAVCLGKSVEMVRVLLEHGANPNFRDREDDAGGNTILSAKWHYRNRNKVPPIVAREIETALEEYGGCYDDTFDIYECFTPRREIDQVLFYACQRLNYRAVQLAVKLGGDLGVRWDEGRMGLATEPIYEAPRLLGPSARKYKWNIESLITDFTLFLLVGMKMPLVEEAIDSILCGCIYRGFEELLTTLLNHHTLGEKFLPRARQLKVDDDLWLQWPEEKRERLRRLLGQ